MMTRGSKTAAEKVVRESESGPDLGSPDKRESIPPVTDMQDSPLFKYLCNLSPIKPAKSVHHAQTYNEMTFPPEPRVFASPRSSRRSSTSSLKRVVAAERLSAQAQAEGRESLGWHPTATNSRSTISDNAPSPSPLNRRSDDHHQVTPCSRRQTEETIMPASQSDSAKRESLVGNDFENLVGQGMFAMNSSQLNPDSEVDRTAATAASFQTQFTDYQQQLEPAVSAAMSSEMARCCSDGNKGGNNNSGGARNNESTERRQSTSSLISQTIDCVMPSQESKCLEHHDNHRRISITSSSHNEDHGLNFSPIATKGSPELDRDTTAMAYFLAGNRNLGQDNVDDEWSEDSSEVVIPGLPLRPTPGYSDNQSDMVNEEPGNQENHVLDPMGSQTGALGPSTTGTVTTTENATHQQSLFSHRADTTGQRGIRRRCLDFDASGARRKSLGSMGGRKSLGSRLKDCSGTTITDGNNNSTSSVLDDVVVPASSDATASLVLTPLNNFPNANDSSRMESDSGAHFRRTSACGDITLGAMTGMQQLTSTSSYQNNIEILKAKAGTTAHTRKAPVVAPPEGVRRSPRMRPSGIGLHLNSLTNTMSFNKRDQSSSGGGESSKGVLATVLGLQPSSKEDSPSEGLGIGGYPAIPIQSFNPGVASLLERRNQMDQMNNADDGNKRVNIPTPDFRSLNIENLAPLEESLSLTPLANLPRLVSPRGQKRSQPHQQELIQQGEEDVIDELLDSPRSKRRRLSRRKSTVSSQSEKSGDGCKRCNCKRSKCLKLYCECFAAGVYCVGTCACHDCFNKPEYDETVQNTRLQILSRNPLAFAPKIVQAAESSPVPGDEALDTPASARHKRGCNCKKSLCLKKYCECYQAGVGCSEGCRCEGCKNMYGRKEGLEEGEAKEGEQQANSSLEESHAEDPIELLNRMSGKSDRLRDCAKPNLSPITPTFEHDSLGQSLLRVRSTGHRRNSFDHEHCASPLVQSSSRLSNNTLDSFHLVPYPQGDTDFSMSAAGDSPMTTPTFARIGHLSPRWEGLGDICTLTPLPVAPLRPTPGSSCVTSDRPGASPAFSSQMTESPYHAASSTSTHHHAASSTSTHHHASSRNWSPHSPRFRQPAPRSPSRFDTPCQSQLSSIDQGHLRQVIPSMQPSQLSGKNLQSELESVKMGADDDEAPEFLKYQDEMGSPSRSTVTKSSSPKQKRVTPPRYGGNREHGDGSGTPPGLRNARKFILQALPTMPPATPSFPNG